MARCMNDSSLIKFDTELDIKEKDSKRAVQFIIREMLDWIRSVSNIVHFSYLYKYYAGLFNYGLCSRLIRSASR